jgi:hypothetical protein
VTVAKKPVSKRKNTAARRKTNYAWHLKTYYKMTYEDYAALLEAQGGRCYICRRKSRKHFHVDHDHNCCPTRPTCGECTRGLLCHDCNFIIIGRAFQELKLGQRHVVYCFLRGVVYLLGPDKAARLFHETAGTLEAYGTLEETENEPLE